MVPIQIENLFFTYPSRDTPTLCGLNAEISAGEFLLLTGPTGCGKSTFLRTINGLIPHSSTGRLTGTVSVDGNNVSTQPLSTTCQQVSLLFQNPDDQLFCTLVEDEIAFGLENIGLPPDEINQRVALALEEVGLSDLRERKISELSGGEKQRVALASICAMQPQILLLDEPTSHLDPRSTHEILTIVKKLNEQKGITVVLASHRVKELDPFIKRVWLMEEGNICLDLPKTEAFQDQSLFKRLGIQVPDPDASSIVVKPDNISDTITTEDEFLRVSDLHYCYGNSEDYAVKSISCNISRGEIVAIMGANGSGKTTLLHLLGGLLRPTKGEVSIDGLNINDLKLHQLAGKVGIVFQNPDLILQAETVKRELAFGPKNLKLKSDILQSHTVDVMERFKIQDLAEDAPFSLSRGQRQRVAVASTFSLQPDLFLLDEPTTGQDAHHLQHLMDELCKQIRHENNILIFATHNIELTLEYADRVIVLHEGRLVFVGTPDTAFADPQLLKEASLVISEI